MIGNRRTGARAPVLDCLYANARRARPPAHQSPALSPPQLAKPRKFPRATAGSSRVRDSRTAGQPGRRRANKWSGAEQVGLLGFAGGLDHMIMCGAARRAGGELERLGTSGTSGHRQGAMRCDIDSIAESGIGGSVPTSKQYYSGM